MNIVSSYIIAFYCAASRVVGITDNKMLDRFAAGLKPKIHEKVLLSQAYTFEKSCIAAERVVVVFIDMGSSSSNPAQMKQHCEGIYQGKYTGYTPMGGINTDL